MTHFSKFHGITQAPNSRNENANFECLAADPVSVSAGRIWFNTTDKALKYSSLDINGAVVVHTIGSIEDMQAVISALQNALSSEISRAQSTESTLMTNLSAEVARAQATDAALDAEVQIRATADAALDKAITAEVSRAQAAEAALSSALAAEAQLRTNGDNALQEQIEAWVKTQIAFNGTTDENRVAAEAALRISKDDALQAELDRSQAAVGLDTDGNLIPITGTNYLDGTASVFASVQALDTQLKVVTDGLAGEALVRQTTGQDFLNQLQAEAIARSSGDVAILQGIDSIRAGAGLEADGSYTPPTGSNYLKGTVSLKGADYIFDAAIKINADAIAAESAAREAAVANEASLRTDADVALDSRVTTIEGQVNNKIGDLSTLTTTDKSTLVAAVNEVNNKVAAETTRATAAEAALASDLAAEISRAQAAEAALTSDLTTEVTARQAADSAEQTARLATEAALKSAINAQQFVYVSAAADLSHTINHGLNSEHILFNIMVESVDGKFRNDTVLVEELDFNSFRIELTEARRVKVAVCAMTALA
jgi:uncharacterized protein YicC (UPF0701 family)